MLLAGLSAWQGLFDRGALTQGQRVLIPRTTGPRRAATVDAKYFVVRPNRDQLVEPEASRRPRSTPRHRPRLFRRRSPLGIRTYSKPGPNRQDRH